ncbi:MAG: hypothetical protein NDI75_04725 [Candidatus Didemnitutus sp.]|nr:hypothetical protein [Candidatus Didemnitutus sp.]
MARNKTIGHSHVLTPEPCLDEKAALRLRTIDHYAGALSVYVAFRTGDG